MADLLYAKDGHLLASDYCEIYIPRSYFRDKVAYNTGASIETLGLLYIRGYNKGVEGPVKLLEIPTIVTLMVYSFEDEEISVGGKPLDVVTLKYLKDSYVIHQSIQKGRIVAEGFLNMMLAGKLPRTLNYANVIDIWWKNIEIADIDYKVPSKIFEMIISSIYRNPKDIKQRFGEIYGKSVGANGYDYTTGNVVSVVEGLSTFSGMIFEDMGRMITSGINSSMTGEEEPISPLEKIIYY